MRQSEPPMPKVDKGNVTLDGSDAAVAIMVDIVPGIQQTTVDPKHV